MYNIVNKTLKTKSGAKRYCIHVLYHQDVKVTCLNKGIGILHSLGYIESLNSRSLSFSFLSACQEEGASFSRLVPSSPLPMLIISIRFDTFFQVWKKRGCPFENTSPSPPLPTQNNVEHQVKFQVLVLNIVCGEGVGRLGRRSCVLSGVCANAAEVRIYLFTFFSYLATKCSPFLLIDSITSLWFIFIEHTKL